MYSTLRALSGHCTFEGFNLKKVEDKAANQNFSYLRHVLDCLLLASSI